MDKFVYQMKVVDGKERGKQVEEQRQKRHVQVQHSIQEGKKKISEDGEQKGIYVPSK